VLVRPAAVAGRFYSDDRHRLAATVDAYLTEGAKRLAATGRVPDPIRPAKALICPHAGYVFSGSVAGTAYAWLESQRQSIRRVVLIGPSHRVAVSGLVAPVADLLDTPLGPITVDPIVQQLVDQGAVQIVDEAHEDEHAIEVHLPFLLQTLEGPFTVVPLLFGQCDPAQFDRMLDRLWGGPETVFIISSDLSHFHNHDVARALDAETSIAIESLKPDDIDAGGACGLPAIQSLLRLAQRYHLTAAAVDVRTSADTAGSPERVVGYGAYVFHG
jgi:hypothetical protein